MYSLKKLKKSNKPHKKNEYITPTYFEWILLSFTMYIYI